MFREAKFFLVTGTTVTSKITAVVSLAKTCIQTCLFNTLAPCSMTKRKKRAIFEDLELSFTSDISASKVTR